MAVSSEGVAAVARGVAAYVRATSAHELPPKLRPHKQVVQTHKGVLRLKDKLFASLDDDRVRTMVAEWLRDAKPSLERTDRQLLDAALERKEGWQEQLASATPERPAKRPTRSVGERLEAERVRTRKARDDARRFREDGRAALVKEKTRSGELEARLKAAIEELAVARRDLDKARTQLARSGDEAEKVERRARRDAERATRERDDAVTKLKSERKELAALKRRVQALERAAASRPRPRPSTRAEPAPSRRRKRAPLRVPKGRMDDAPETLEEWLDTATPTLLVDGYNVAKADGGFGDVSLERQRERVVHGVTNLARRKKFYAIVVFDGADVSPGTKRRSRGSVAVEYSSPNETADDHLIALLEALPPEPVILVTNDRGLQDRALVLGATIAHSGQLLALIR